MGSRYIYICISLFHLFFFLYFTMPPHLTTQPPKHPTPGLRTRRNERKRNVTSFVEVLLDGSLFGRWISQVGCLGSWKEISASVAVEQIGRSDGVGGSGWLQLALFFWVDGSGMTVKKNKGDPQKLKGCFSVFFCCVTSDQVGSCIELYIRGCFFFVIWWWVDRILVVCFWMSRDVVRGSKITWRKQRCGEFTVAAVSNLWLYMIIPFIPHTLINQFTMIVVHKCERQCHFLKDIL